MKPPQNPEPRRSATGSDFCDMRDQRQRVWGKRARLRPQDKGQD